MTILARFIIKNNLSMTSERTDQNPHMDSQNMDHWRCVLRRGKSSVVVYFSKGYGYHGQEPTLDEVLDCMASDASGYDNAQSFEDWCSEYGFDTDSRKAERTYKTIQRQSGRLKELLGQESFDELIWNTERM
jgi:hypothetical protein